MSQLNSNNSNNSGVIYDSSSSLDKIFVFQPNINFADFVDKPKKVNGESNLIIGNGEHIKKTNPKVNDETVKPKKAQSKSPTYKKDVEKTTLFFESKNNIGNGVEYKGKKFITHTNLDYDKSALKTFETWQVLLFGGSISSFLVALIINPRIALTVFLAILTFIYFIDLIFNLYLILKSLHFPPEMFIKDEEVADLDDNRLPIYSILCPLYKEANVLTAFVKAIEIIDWPKEKLDVLLLLEEDDEETINKANSLDLPENFSIHIVPNSLPKTKPKACNYGFAFAKGEFVVIYDAEDRPDPLQLKKAYIAFNKADPKVVCLQCKLNYYNPDQNLLTKLFTAEYSLWFDLALPALQSISTTLPLGGTSNHFKSSALRFLGAWDPFNVTEDCDLGTRLFKEGFKTALINSTTYEEANSKVGSWIKQRSRWIKGYLQTYLVHMRDPVEFFEKHGVHALVFQLVIGMRMVFILINPILWMMTLSYFLFTATFGPFIESLYPSLVFYVAAFCLVFGNFMYFYNYMIGLAKRRQWDLIKYVFLIPFYWAMTSISAVMAFYQLIVKPHHWEKTQHGLHLIQPKFILPKFKVYLDFSLPFDLGFISKMPGKIFSAFYIILRNFYDLMDILGEIPSLKKSKRGKLNILIFNWRDKKHVWAGGAEVYIQEIGKQWAREGHSVTTFCGWDGKSSRNDTIDGVNIIRRGGFYSVYPFAFLYYLLKLRGKFDVVIDCENGIPFFAPFFVEVPIILLIHHIHQDIFRNHLSFPFSFVARQLETNFMPVLYKNFTTITVSESSKKDIIRVGWGNQENIHIVNPGIDAEKFGDRIRFSDTHLFVAALGSTLDLYLCPDDSERGVR